MPERLTPDDSMHGLSHERTYLTARYLALVATGVIVVLSRLLFAEEINSTPAVLGVLIFAVSTAIVLIARRRLGSPLEKTLVWIAPFDLIVLGLLVFVYHDYGDPAFAGMAVLAVLYGLIVSQRNAWLFGLMGMFVYLMAVLPHVLHSGVMVWAAVVAKTLAIGYISIISANSSARQAEHESWISMSNAENEQLNVQLQRRVSELQAISQINEIIHSSLDFDRVGPLVLDVLTKVFDIPSCCLFVIDKRKGKTLFSASARVGEQPQIAAPIGLAGNLEAGFELGDSHFQCTPVADHHQMMVVFCADAESMDSMVDEDRFVLQAVASELVVAVENSQLYKLTKRLAITDELTGLYNYRFLQQRLDEEIERARRYSKDLSLLMLDVDNFKGLNDELGHIAGDQALSELGTLLRDHVRDVDIVCRYGGEEFSVILPETDAAGAFVVAEKIRETIALFEFVAGEGRPGVRMTISIGLATFPAHSSDKETLLKLADDALYQAKNGGKDRVRSPLQRRPAATRDSGAAPSTDSTEG